MKRSALRRFCSGAKGVMLNWTTAILNFIACATSSSLLSGFPGLPIAVDQRAGRAIMGQFWLFGALQFRDDAVCQHLAKFNAPLVERVDVPDGSLGEDFMLV